MRIHLLLQDLDLLLERGQHRHRGAGRGRVRRGEYLGLTQVLSAQHRLDPSGLLRDIAAAGPDEGGTDLGDRQLRRRGRVRCPGQQLQHISGIQILEGLQRGREVLPQRVAQPLGVTGPFPDQRLGRPRHHLHRPGRRAVRGHRTQLVRIGAHHLSQRVRIGGIAFRARHAMPFPVPSHLQRVNRVHRVPGSDQRGHPRPPVGLDADQHLHLVGVLAQLLTDHRVQPRHPGHPLGQPGLRQPPPPGIHHLHVMVRLGPVIPHEKQRLSPPSLDHHQPPAGEPSAT
jgi:hypothetical protein